MLIEDNTRWNILSFPQQPSSCLSGYIYSGLLYSFCLHGKINLAVTERDIQNKVWSVSVSVYYVAVRTIVLSRHGSNLERPVIIHDIIHGLIYVPYCGFFGVSPDGHCAYVHWGSFTSNSKSVRRAIWFTWFSEPHDSVYGTWQSQAVTHPLMNRARRRLTSVIEQISMSERRIPMMLVKC